MKKKKYKIAYPYNKRKRPLRLGPVSFLPLCASGKKIYDTRKKCERCEEEK